MYKIIIVAILLLLLLYKKKDKFGNNNLYEVTVVFITRFSILDGQSGSWMMKRTSKNCSELKKRLFDKKICANISKMRLF